MDFLNKAFAQVSDLFGSMTPGSRITAGLLLIVVVISLGYLFTYQIAGSDEYLMGGEYFSPDQLQKMQAAFGTAGLSYELEGTRLRIPHGQKAKYMAALVDGDALPPQWGKALGDALKNESVFLNKQQREERLKNAKQKELGLYISAMKGIRRAAVVYDTKVERAGFTRKTLNTASVSVEPMGPEQLDERRVAAIRHLVSGAIAGMKPGDVTVTDLNTGSSHYGDSESGDGSLGDQHQQRVRKWEEHWKKKILEQVKYISGVIVTPTVELDRKKSHVTKTLTPDPKGTARLSTEKTSSRTHEGSAPQGRPGFQANQPIAAPATRGRGSTESEDESETVDQLVVGGMEEQTETVGQTPIRVRVAVGVPNSYFIDVWRKHNPTPEGEEAKEPDKKALEQIQQEVVGGIEESVARVLPEAEGINDKTELVTVKPFDDITPPAIPEPGLGEDAMAWLGQYWGTLGTLGLAAFSLLMLRSMIRTASAGPAAEGRPAQLPKAAESEQPESEESAKARRLRRFSGSGASLRDELSELVQEDPDSAANILQNWIGSPTIKT